MIHEHEALELASAGIDFGAVARARARAHASLRECPVCAERAASYREQIRLMQRLPVLDASDATRRRITAAAMSGRTETRSPMFILLAAALLLGLLLGVTAVVGFIARRPQPGPVDLVEPSASPIGSAVAVAPEPRRQLRRHRCRARRVRSGPSILGTDTVAEVVGDEPSGPVRAGVGQESIKLRALSATGRPSVCDVRTRPCRRLRLVPGRADRRRRLATRPTNCRSGWVASADHDGTPWVRPAAADCPRPRWIVEVARVDVPTRASRLPSRRANDASCDRPARRTTRAASADRAASAPWSGGWVAHSNSVRSPAGATLEVAIDPASDVNADDIGTDRLIVLHGSFDRPDALGCRRGGARTRLPALPSSSPVEGCSSSTGSIADPFDLRSGSAATVDHEQPASPLGTLCRPGSRLLEPLLDEGTPLSVIGGPVLASGYTWYEVVVPSQATVDGGS